jgi:hypothetical protein
MDEKNIIVNGSEAIIVYLFFKMISIIGRIIV